MMRFLTAILALMALLIAILVIAPGLIPVSAYKARLEAAASTAIGRSVTVGDGLRFQLVPKTAFRVGDLTVANAEGFEGSYLLTVKDADIGVRLMPLLKGEVEIERFVLTEPDINLARAKDGRVNWTLGQAPPPAEGAPSGEEPRDVRLGDVRIVDGRARYADAAAGKTYTLSDIDAAVRLNSLAEPLEFDGSMIFEGAPSRVKLVLTSLRKMMAREPANLKLDLALGKTTIAGDLTVATDGALAFTGPLSLSAPNLPEFAKLLGSPLAEGPGFDKLSVSGEAVGGPDSLRLAGAKIGFDAIDAVGDIGLKWGGARPKATGRLAVGSLDLRPYLPPPPTAPQGFPAWSEEKIDFASLRNIDADLDLSAERIFLNDLKFGESRMKLRIDDGRLVADIPELGMYGGGGSGQLVVNARQRTPSISGKFDIGSVQAEPFTKDLMKLDKLLGLGGFKLDFSASGASQAAIMRSMTGSGGFDLADGAIKGVNLAKLARAIDEIRRGGVNPAAIANAISTAQQPDEKTDFNEFLSRFTIVNGQVSAPTISLKGPFVAMSGNALVNLPGQTLDLRLAPRATTTIDGQGGQALAIPVRVTGTFSQPRLGIDAEALLRGRLEGGLQDFLNKALKPGDAGRAQGGSGSSQSGAPPSGGETDPARLILDGIFGPAPQQGGTRGQTPAGDGPTQTATPIEETILKQGLGRILGGRRPPAGAEPAPAGEETETPPQ